MAPGRARRGWPCAAGPAVAALAAGLVFARRWFDRYDAGIRFGAPWHPGYEVDVVEPDSSGRGTARTTKRYLVSEAPRRP